MTRRRFMNRVITASGIVAAWVAGVGHSALAHHNENVQRGCAGGRMTNFERVAAEVVVLVRIVEMTGLPAAAAVIPGLTARRMGAGNVMANAVARIGVGLGPRRLAANEGLIRARRSGFVATVGALGSRTGKSHLGDSSNRDSHSHPRRTGIACYATESSSHSWKKELRMVLKRLN